jgi:ADP-heptose:LPS heptosyltransferase
VDEKQATVMWAWGPGEESVIDEVQGLTRGVTHKAPKTSFREMAALFARADLFIGNSNGPSHVAVSVDLPSIQLHGHTNLISWCPMTERHRGLQTPGFGKISMPPISDISLDEVKDLVCAMWPNGSPPRL